MSTIASAEIEICLCQDCGGAEQRDSNDLSRYYDQANDEILHLCIACEVARVVSIDPEDYIKRCLPKL